MGKNITVILIVLAIVLIGYNVTFIDFNNPFKGNSVIALIGILAALCAIILLLIFLTSKKIQKKIDED
ncbi:hypothetical protein [Maribacter arenosus]|uniref:Uncharacterized protein n=1 Tax=Maribacter arenosus TaxID=1854708 RepID=A0ABR7V9X0_9FLAO|nr:hypothetical protein [Maribacter arenosus]MBD0850460.1 hypothetical protein [Maribacter arenosus]